MAELHRIDAEQALDGLIAMANRQNLPKSLYSTWGVNDLNVLMDCTKELSKGLRAIQAMVHYLQAVRNEEGEI